VSEVVPPAQCLDRALEVAISLAGLPADALKTTRRLIRPSQEALLERTSLENAEFARLLATPDARAAFAAFQSNRKG
jgi:enoyl-CoA hydratase/carnithine racemase